MFKMGSHDPFGYLKHKLWLKEGLRIKLSIRLQPLKSRITLIYLCAGGMSHIVKNLLMMITTLLETAP
jgi:hypothetical protein